MKTLAIVVALSGVAMACPQGTTEYEGNCAADIPAEKAVQTAVPSDEAPPRSGMPAYQDPSIHADMPASTASEDAKLDAEKAKADNDGKKAAGIDEGKKP